MNHAQKIYNDTIFREYLKTYGVVHIPNAIRPEYVHRALKYVNYDIGQFHNDLKLDAASRGRYHSSHADIMNIYYKSFLPRLFEMILGPRDKNYMPLDDMAQLPIRFPDDLCENSEETDILQKESGFENQRKKWHVDNIAHIGDQGHHESILNFDATIVILLSDSHHKLSGELVTYPGSHRILGSYMKSNSSIYKNMHYIGLDALPRYDKSDAVLGSKPYHCLGKAGDVFILNYMNAHTPTCNLSPYIRYAAFFRLVGSEYPKELVHKHEFKEIPTSMMNPLLHWKI